MKTRHIFGMLAAATLLMSGLSACSDNYDTELKPIQNALFLKVNDYDHAFSVDYSAERNPDILVNVESNTLWKVSIESNGGWCMANRVTGRGNESFTLEILENINDERKATITVYMVDDAGDPIHVEGQTTSLEMTLKQDGSDVRLSPSAFEPFQAQGNKSMSMTIDANVAWTLEVRYEGENPARFIGITPSSGNMTSAGDGTFKGEGSATFNMSVADNTTAANRRAYITLNSTVGTYNVEVIQNKSEYTFAASRSDMAGIVAEKGDVLDVEIQSSFRWLINAPSWIRLDAAEGAPASSPIRVSLDVEPNLTSSNRTGEIIVTPLPTESAAGVSIDPSKVGIIPVIIPVTQFGGREAAISIPWLADGYTNTSATIEFNFYSPFYDITEAGLEWGFSDGTDRQTISTYPSDPIDCTVSFNLTGLNPATRYVARGYVKYSDGNIKYGNWSYPFTTAGRYPGSDDNPTPTP